MLCKFMVLISFKNQKSNANSVLSSFSTSHNCLWEQKQDTNQLDFNDNTPLDIISDLWKQRIMTSVFPTNVSP
jgi:hypothetical protein